MGIIRALLGLLLLISTAQSQVGFRQNPFTTNGPLGQPLVIVGDSTSQNGYWDAGYPSTASGIGNDWPGRLLQSSNFWTHGIYFNLASNNATIVNWTNRAGGLQKVLTNVLASITNAGFTPNITFLLGPNDITDINFQTLTNQYVDFFNQMTNYRAHLYILTPPTNATYIGPFAGYNTTRTNLAAWELSLTNANREVFNLDNALTNSAQFIIDGVHPNALGNSNIAAYVNGNKREAGLFRTINRNSDPILASTVQADFMIARGVASTDFNTASPGLNMQFIPSGTYGYIFAVDSAGASSFRPLLLRGNPLQLLGGTSSGTIVIDQAGLPTTTTYRLDVNGSTFVETNLVVGGTASAGLGQYYPSNGIAVATIKAGMTNGACWIGMLSNSIQLVCMSNNITSFKIIGPN